ncbi:MAG: hypothetical protein ABSG97_00460 [Sedimentisphaerales bacterium]|jgi:hypothetical protein
MKMLSALFAILMMLWMCTSSYGYLLVYKLDGAIRGTEGTVDINKVTISFGGYLVMNFDNDTNTFEDANLFLKGRDPNNNHKVYVQLNASDSNGFLDPSIWYRDVRNFYELNGEPPFDFRIVVMGNVKNKDIGLAGKKRIASSLHGVITGQEGMFFAVGQELAGVGIHVSVPLYTSLTKTANKPGEELTQDEVVDELKNKLAHDHYLPVSIPAP